MDDFDKKLEELKSRIPALQSKAAETDPQKDKNAVAVVQLPLWPEPVRAVPNGFLRSALFGAIGRGKRRYIDGEDLAACGGVTVRYKGQQLDQSDLDVWESVLHAVRLQALGTQCRVTSYSLLKLMGLTDSGPNRTTLFKRIERLVANAVTITQGRYTYMGGLIEKAVRDKITHEWVIKIDPELAPIYSHDQFTMIDWAIRQSMSGKPLAQWLHGYYATHANPYDVNVATLLKLSGSKNSNPKSARQTLTRSLDALSAACTSAGQPLTYEIADDLVHVTKSPSATQRLHLHKKAVSKRAKKTRR